MNHIPNRIIPFTKLAKALGEDEPITLEKDIHTLGENQRRIVETALRHYIDALADTSCMLKTMGHVEASVSCGVERSNARDLLDLIADCWQVDLIPED